MVSSSAFALGHWLRLSKSRCLLLLNDLLFYLFASLPWNRLSLLLLTLHSFAATATLKLTQEDGQQKQMHKDSLIDAQTSAIPQFDCLKGKKPKFNDNSCDYTGIEDECESACEDEGCDSDSDVVEALVAVVYFEAS